jgi:hypothetical protein
VSAPLGGEAHQRAEEVVRDFAAARPQASALAEVVSFAVLVDRPLLRQARVRLVPDADAGAEADLWLGPLIKSRSNDGITFPPAIAGVLRRRLAANAERAADAWRLTNELHAHLPPTLKLEETINRLSIDESEEAAHRIDELLSSVLAAMTAGGRDGLASWAARALENFPTSVRRRSAAQMLAAGANLRLGIDPRASLRGELPEWLRFIAPAHLETASVGVQLAPHLLRVDASPKPTGPLLRLPATRPLLLDVSWTASDGQPEGRQLALQPGDVQHLPVGADEVQLRTVTGDVYELRLGGTAPAEARPWIIDFSEVINRLGDKYVDEGRVEDITFASPSTRITVVSGQAGAGKTSTLAEIVRRLRQQGTFCAHHFFDSGTPKLEYWEYAERSLIAQFMTRFDLPSWALTMRLSDFLRTFASSVGTGPVYIVLDNIDVVKPGLSIEELVPPADLPVQFRLVASSTAMTGFWLRAGLVRSVALDRPAETQVTISSDSLRRPLLALAVARAPLPLVDAHRLRARVDRLDLSTPWTTERLHLGEPSIVIIDGRRREFVLLDVEPRDIQAAHRELAMAVAGPDLPPEERTWYGIRHGAWHWLQAGGVAEVPERLMPARVLRRAIELFGARVTVDILEEVARDDAS